MLFVTSVQNLDKLKNREKDKRKVIFILASHVVYTPADCDFTVFSIILFVGR